MTSQSATRRRHLAGAAVFIAVFTGHAGLTPSHQPQADAASVGSPNPLADTCGEPPGPRPADDFPVKLPRVSLLGARNDLPNSYEAGVHWGQLPNGRVFGAPIGLANGPDGTIWVFDNCAVAGPPACANSPLDPILQFDKSGRLLKSFGKGLTHGTHKIKVDPQGNVWITDIGGVPGIGHQVIKFSPEGKVLMRLGQAGVAGPGLDQFDQPTDVAIAANGDFFVSDGQSGAGTATGNARIMKFDKNGKFLKTWGHKGMGPGEFDLVHALALDSRGRLFVADRQNNRVQIFDQDGNFIDQWFQFGRPSGIYIDKDDNIYVGDSSSLDGRSRTGKGPVSPNGIGVNLGGQRGIRIGSAKDGTVREFIPDTCPYPYLGTPTMGDGILADDEGNVYSGEFLGTIRKFAKKH